MIYFDHNATTPLHPVARQAWLEASEQFIGNPSSPHRVGARADAALAEARQALADTLGCHPLDIVWTSGATESNNMVLHHVARRLGVESEVWVCAIEHPCVLQAARRYFGKRHRIIPVERSGVIDLDWLRRELAGRRPGLVAVMAANNETGVLQPWRQVLSLCREREVRFFCDAAQWIGKLACNGLGDCDFVSGCAHKFGGPVGVGFLKCPTQGGVEPLLLGGQQEEGRRAGTENVAGVVSMLAALKVREATLNEGIMKNGELPSRDGMRTAFETQLRSALPGSEIVGAESPRLWNTVSALLPEAGRQQRWVVKLDKLGFAVSTGSACASGKEAPSHVLAAMGYNAAEAGRVVRFSSGWSTTRAEWTALVKGLKTVFIDMAPSKRSTPKKS